MAVRAARVLAAALLLAVASATPMDSGSAVSGVVAAVDNASGSDATLPSGENGFGAVSYSSTDASASASGDDDGLSEARSVASLDSDTRLRLRMGFF
jgi:hypothetical protein